MLEMWPHFVNLLWRSLYAMPSLISSNWVAVFMGIGIFVLSQLLILWRRGLPTMKRQWAENVGIGIASLIGGWIVLYFLSVVVTVYNDHHDLAGRLGAVVNEKNELKQGSTVRDNNIHVLMQQDESLKSQLESCCKHPSTSNAEPRASTIRAFRRELEKGQDGLARTEFTLTSDTNIPPPLTIELEFGRPISGLGSVPVPTFGAFLLGGDRWDGTHGFATIPNTGINPNLSWVVVVKSLQGVNLVKPPHPRAGY